MVSERGGDAHPGGDDLKQGASIIFMDFTRVPITYHQEHAEGDEGHDDSRGGVLARLGGDGHQGEEVDGQRRDVLRDGLDFLDLLLGLLDGLHLVGRVLLLLLLLGLARPLLAALERREARRGGGPPHLPADARDGGERLQIAGVGGLAGGDRGHEDGDVLGDAVDLKLGV